MRDEAVASQDQDPTTEGVPSGKTPDGHGENPSDASETIVSGTHAAATGKARDNAAPAEHDAWDAEFAGLAGTGPDAGTAHERKEASAGTASETGDAPAPVADAPSADGNESSRSGAAAPDDAGGAAAPARTREEVPGGHPSLAQRSTLPMRAASTMPDLSRYGTDDSAGNDVSAGTGDSTETGDSTGTKGTAATDETASAVTGTADKQASGQDPAVSEPHPTTAEGGPWYGPGTGERQVSGEDSAANAAVPETAAMPAADPAVPAEEAERRNAERERAASAKPVLGRVIQVAIAVFFPVMLLAAAIRAVATPLFLWIEYNRPGFPADSFGFSTDDRMTYGSYAVDYLLNFASPRYLGDLVTPDGDSLYLATEVSHMADVKMVLSLAFVTALGMALLSIAGGIYLARRCPGGIRRALFAGAVATLALIAGLLVAAVLAWEEFFTMVHTIFFAQGNWTFRLDDTLIRLFPAQFWMDAGGAIAAIVLIVCVLVMVFTWPTKKRRERSRLAREESRRRYLESLEAL